MIIVDDKLVTKRTCLTILVIRTESPMKPTTEKQNRCKEPQFERNCSNAQSCDNREICDPEQKIQCCCPDGLYRSGEKCVKKEECPCYHNGTEFVRLIVFLSKKTETNFNFSYVEEIAIGNHCMRIIQTHSLYFPVFEHFSHSECIKRRS